MKDVFENGLLLSVIHYDKSITHKIIPSNQIFMVTHPINGKRVELPMIIVRDSEI